MRDLIRLIEEVKEIKGKSDSETLPEIASLRWLANQFPFIKNPKDDIEKMQNCIHSYCSHGADKLEKLSKALKEQDWIPVTERNPNKNGNYLVTVRSWDETASIDFEDVDHCNADSYWLHYHDSANKKKGRRVIAWKAIEPYIGESNGKEN